MGDQYKIKSRIGIIIGIVSFVIGFGISSPETGEGFSDFGGFIIVAGYIALIWGSGHWVKGKGYQKIWSLLGLMHIFGVIIIALLPNKKKPMDIKREVSDGGIKEDQIKLSGDKRKKRTIKNIRVSNKSTDEVYEFLQEWLKKKRLKIRDVNSDGSPILSIINMFRLKPHVGCTLFLKKTLFSIVVFEVSVRQDGKDSIIHGEFYAPGSFIFMGLELNLSPGLLGYFPRKKGNKILLKLMDAIENFQNQ